MPETLTEIETRIVGSLVEKQLTTPEYYPLTLNALVNACNQKNNRHPLVAFDERTVTDALERLRDRNIVYVFYGSTSRVPKYKHMLPTVYELEPAEVAIICELMLRGPQTPGELRGRCERLYEFSGLGEVQETLDSLARRDDPLIVKLPVQPGRKEARFAHLLNGEIDVETVEATFAARPGRDKGDNDRIEHLEAEISRLSAEVDQLKAGFSEFRKQFE
jgi:uncharacterized protein YceH (UPF0502 family)